MSFVIVFSKLKPANFTTNLIKLPSGSYC